jgi:MATE family multidrug resistance protein
MLFMAIWGFVDSGNLVLSGALKGAGDTRFVMIYSLVMAWGVLVPGQFLIVIVWEAGVIIAWAWTAFYIALLAIGFYCRFRAGHWRDIDMLETSRPIHPDRPGAEAMVVGD